MKKIIFLTLLYIPLLSKGQQMESSPGKRNGVSLGLGGNGSLVYLEYERFHYLDGNEFFSFGGGAGWGREGRVWQLLGQERSPKDFVTLPHKVSYAIGGVKNYLELGLGGTYVFGDTEQKYLAYPLLGYRFQNHDLNTIFKFYISWPFMGIRTKDIFFLPVGISFGQSF